MKITIEADDEDPDSLRRARKLLAELTAEAETRERIERTGHGKKARALLHSSISELDLSARSFNALTEQRIETIGQLCALDIPTLRRFPGIGAHSLAEIRAALETIDLPLASED